MNYTRLERLVYLLRRHAVFAVILVPAILFLAYLPADTQTVGQSLLTLILIRAARAALGVSLAILFAKFAFPKVDLQREIIEDQNVAVALLFAGIVIGVNLG